MYDASERRRQACKSVPGCSCCSLVSSQRKRQSRETWAGLHLESTECRSPAEAGSIALAGTTCSRPANRGLWRCFRSKTSPLGSTRSQQSLGWQLRIMRTSRERTGHRIAQMARANAALQSCGAQLVTVLPIRANVTGVCTEQADLRVVRALWTIVASRGHSGSLKVRGRPSAARTRAPALPYHLPADPSVGFAKM